MRKVVIAFTLVFALLGVSSLFAGGGFDIPCNIPAELQGTWVAEDGRLEFVFAGDKVYYRCLGQSLFVAKVVSRTETFSAGDPTGSVYKFSLDIQSITDEFVKDSTGNMFRAWDYIPSPPLGQVGIELGGIFFSSYHYIKFLTDNNDNLTWNFKKK